VKLPIPIPRLNPIPPRLPADVLEAISAARRRLEGDYSEDEWGYDEEFVTVVRPIVDWLYDRWWRVEVTGAENLPAEGRALLVANHAGVLARETPSARRMRFLVLDWAFGLPFISGAVRRVGGVPASPHNAIQLLEEDHMVAVFPEGSRGAAKPYRERYRLQRFGRGGFVQVALRSRAPIIPVAVVGSEEIYPNLGDAPVLAKLVGTPYLPITPTFPLLGPLGAIPLPSRWRIEFCPPIDLSRYGPEAAEDDNLVLEVSDAVRDQIQLKLYENLVRRGHTFW
jgi:1-acyl-sn-glycerol-3-phosphate acyltransferase